MKWYAIVFNQHGHQCYKTQAFLNRQYAVNEAERYVRNNSGCSYQIFQA